MPRTDTHHGHVLHESGFVLVGVVMFVLALTILGLSLFSLSSFEAQFLGRSSHETQAFHYAAGGIDRCKFVLAQTGLLDAVGAGVSEATPFEGIVYASAVQGTSPPDSTGFVQWDPSLPITITVRARDMGAECTLQAQFRPGVQRNPYKYVLATHRASGAVYVNPTGGDPNTDRRNTLSLDGRVWQNDHNEAYTSLLEAFPSGGVRLDSVPEFDVSGFIAGHQGAAQPAYNAGGNQWQVHGTGITFFKSTGADPQGYFSLRTSTEATISVRDTAVWLFPKGFRFDGMVTVQAADPTKPACLIMVANRNGSFSDKGVNYFETAAWFFGGVKSSNVPIIIATHDEIRLEQFNNSQQDANVPYMSMYAGFIFLMGPRSPTYHMRLHHTVPYESDYLIDRLVAQGALPGSEYLSPSRFKLVAGSWQEINP